jgi:hypothetical protein
VYAKQPYLELSLDILPKMVMEPFAQANMVQVFEPIL